jgi:hypothetical protein
LNKLLDGKPIESPIKPSLFAVSAGLITIGFIVELNEKPKR